MVLAIGLGLRIYGLDSKVYWHDEVYTTMRAVGYSKYEVYPQIFNQGVTAGQLQQFQQLNSGQSWMNTWASLINSPEHPPLFYLLERLWIGFFGNGVGVTRSLSVLFSVALFPLMACLFNSLYGMSFPDAVPGKRYWPRHYVSVLFALLAVSPLQVIYSQEAREYSLWACEIVLASFFLLRLWADNLQGARTSKRAWGSWLGYCLAMVLGLYTTLLTALVILAHGAFLLWESAWKPLRRWMMAIAVAMVLFIPWLWVIARSLQKVNNNTAWTKADLPLRTLANHWGLHLGAAWVDLGLQPTHSYHLLTAGVTLILLSLCWFQVTQPPVRRFLLCLMGVPTLMLIGADVVLGGQRSIASRYFMPLALAVVIVMALGISLGLRSSKRFQRLATQIMLVAVLVVGGLSCSRYALAPAWWNKGFNQSLPPMAAHMTSMQQNQPVKIWMELGATGLGSAISLSHLLPPEASLYLFDLPHLPPEEKGRIFIPYASEAVIEAFAQAKRPIAPVEAPGVSKLWQWIEATD